jgi:C4-dicarboxylate transporter DctM subunit
MVKMFFSLAIAMLVSGIPIAVTIGLAAVIYLLASGSPTHIISQRLFAGIDSSALMAIPFFVLAGDLMNRGGLAKRIVTVANLFVGRMTGGLGIVTILGCMFFAAISGSGVATAAALGGIMIPAMVMRGYDRSVATSIVAASSPIGVIIPPSLTFIIYGVLAQCSITDLYKAGIPAGLIMGGALMITAYLLSRKHGYRGDDSVAFSWKAALKASVNAGWALGTPVIIVGGVFGGVFTPTESAVVAVVYSVLVGLFAYRDLKIRDLPKIFLESGKTTAKIMFIISCATLFVYVITFNRIPHIIVDYFMGLTENPILLLLIINVILLVAGTFMETTALLLITVPLFVPLITRMGVDLIHFGIIITVNTAIGLMTPPFGVCLFTSASVGGVPVATLSKRVLYFLLAQLIALFLISFIPSLVMFLV